MSKKLEDMRRHLEETTPGADKAAGTAKFCYAWIKSAETAGVHTMAPRYL